MSPAACAWGLLALFTWLAMCRLGIYISDQKGRRPIEGFLFAAFMGPLGLILAALLPDERR